MGAIVNAANCAVASASGGVWLITKIGGNPNVEDASAISDFAIAGDFILRARLVGSGNAFVGVAPDPAAGVDGTAIPRAFLIGPNTARVVESGVFRPPLFGLVGYVWIRRTGPTLDYLSGSELATAQLRRSASEAGPLFFDSSILSMDAIVEVKFGPPSAFAKARTPRPRLTLGLGV